MSHIFVSYSSTDRDFVEQLVGQLQRSYRVWWDRNDIHGGSDWEEAIKSGVTNCELMIVVLSQEATNSAYVRFEYETALSLGKPVIPLRYEDCKIPVKLQEKQYVVYKDGYFDDLETALSDHAKVSRTQDTSYLSENQLIGDSSQTFGDLESKILGSFTMDPHETDLVALPMMVSQYSLSYLVGKRTDSLKRQVEIQLALQCSQDFNSANFPLQVAKHVLNQGQALHMILVRGPMMLSEHPRFGIKLVHGLNNNVQDEWRDVVRVAYSSLKLYEHGTSRRDMIHVFNIAPAALLGGLGISSERGRGMTFYNYNAPEYNDVFTVPPA